MAAKIVEVIAKILEGLNKNITLDEVNKLLSKDKEFDKQTVSVAFSLVYDKVLSSRVTHKQERDNTDNIRMLTEEEKELLGIENSNYILHLYNVGLLNSVDLELVLEQAALFPENTITKEDINWIILISLVDFNEDILPGSRILLYSSDKIN